jgi:hypothetical protein
MINVKACSFIFSLLIFQSILCAQVLKVNYDAPEEVGRISSSRINEASGMAFSYITDDAFWVHNDSGDGPNLYLVNKSGELLTLGQVSGATATDWEDMASFVVNNKSYLIVGDFGDNARLRTNYKLYILEEPIYNPLGTNPSTYPVLRTINYQYDNGSQNCESVGVDVSQGKIILFSKSHDNEVRYVYEIPLSVAPGTETTTATRIASLSSDDTTAMDISNDGHRAVVLTYKDFAYEFTREDGETWQQAFNQPYNTITMPIGRAGEEAVAYDTNGFDIYTIREGLGSEIYVLTGTEEEDPNSPNKAEFVSQSNIPKVLDKGEVMSVSITMRNIGTSTWTKADLFKLGSVDDKDALGLIRVELEASDAIAPNEEKTFTFNITGTNIPGVYDFRWRMIQENISWFGERTPKEKIVVLSSNKYLDDCDSKIDWNPGVLQLTSTDIVQGTAALEFNGSNTDEFSKVFTTPYDAMGTRSGTVLQFWYYVSDPSKFDAPNQVEISSSGGPDTDEYNWSLSNLKAGWNFIQLPISGANRMGAPNLSAINWFRLYRFKNGAVTTRLDGIQLIGENALSVSDFEKKTKLRLYPVPANDVLNINLDLQESSHVSLVLLDVFGHMININFSNKIMAPGNNNIDLPISQLKSGSYFLKININNSITTKQFVIK